MIVNYFPFDREQILSLSKKQILDIVQAQDTLSHKFETVFNFINACNVKYDFFTIQSLLSLVDEYLSNEILANNEIYQFSAYAFPTVRLYLLKTNKVWQNCFNSQQLLFRM